MIVPDSNLLLYAYNTAAQHHEKARRWWEGCLSGNEPVGLIHPVIFSFLRIGTSTRAFPNPLTLSEASECIRSWMGRSITRVLTPRSGHVERVLKLLEDANSAGGPLVTDAQIAAIAIVNRGTIHTADRDFMRFEGLQCRYPLE